MSDGDSASSGDSATSTSTGSPGPLIFISHDTRDAELAEALSKLLSSVSAGMLKTFRSSDRKGSQGFEYGVEWYPELMKRLDAACDVVCLLTEQSLGRPWLLYEAGVAKGKLDIPVHGVALGVPLSKASAGPFAQFQNCDDDADSLTKLVIQLVQRLPHADPDAETVRSQVDTFKLRVDKILAQQSPDGSEELEHDEASTAKLFEEIKVMFQDLPSRVDSAAARAASPRLRKQRLHPGMIDEMAHMIGRGRPNPGIVALIVASACRDELPWLYEMGVEAYRASLSSDTALLKRSLRQFTHGAEMAAMGPFSRELRSSNEMRMLVEELPMLLHRFDLGDDEIPEADDASLAPEARKPAGPR
jgi:hypothetical protein